MNTKKAFLDHLSRHLIKTSEWRRVQFECFPTDVRNQRATAALFRLATQATEISDDLWQEVEPLFQPTNERWTRAVSQARIQYAAL